MLLEFTKITKEKFNPLIFINIKIIIVEAGRKLLLLSWNKFYVDILARCPQS